VSRKGLLEVRTALGRRFGRAGNRRARSRGRNAGAGRAVGIGSVTVTFVRVIRRRIRGVGHCVAAGHTRRLEVESGVCGSRSRQHDGDDRCHDNQ